MRIESTEVAIKLTIRQAQSLLMFMREVEGLGCRWKGMEQLPNGVMSDIKGLKRDFEGLLLMDDQRSHKLAGQTVPMIDLDS